MPTATTTTTTTTTITMLVLPSIIPFNEPQLFSLASLDSLGPEAKEGEEGTVYLPTYLPTDSTRV